MRRIQRRNITKREYQERELKKRIKKEIKKQEDYKDMFEDLKEIICEYVDVSPETIKEDSRFIEDLGFNSCLLYTSTSL